MQFLTANGTEEPTVVEPEMLFLKWLSGDQDMFHGDRVKTTYWNGLVGGEWDLRPVAKAHIMQLIQRVKRVLIHLGKLVDREFQADQRRNVRVS
jgi:hypothetical protein